MSARRLTASERRTVVAGAAVLAVAWAASAWIAPAVRRWSDREAAIAATRERVARLQQLIGQEPELVAAAATRDAEGEGTLRVLRGRTPALASSNLQGLLQEYARMSRVSVSRLATTEADSTRYVEASVSAVTDVYGLADLLARLQGGSLLLEIAGLSVAPNPVLRGNLLQVALTVRAPFVLEP